MRLTARTTNPYSENFNNDTLDSTRIGDWYGAITGRGGYATERGLFYLKGGVGFANLQSSVTDTCSIAPCGAGLLNASTEKFRAFFVGGGGMEWAWHDKWTVKAEYLYLGINENFNVCGPGGGAAAGSTFCASHSLSGVHTGKLG